MKFLKDFFILVTAIGAFLLVAGAAGSHGQFKFRSHMTGDWFVFGTPLIGVLGLIMVWLKKRRLNSDGFKMRIGDKEEFKKLMDLLEKAITVLRKISTDDELLNNLRISIDNLKLLKLEEIQNVWTWFAPRGLWDDSVGEAGTDLGNEIFELAECLRRQIH
jgi:hypothetical protein